MAIPFGNIVKAQITQAVLATLLERGGYRVTRLGIEELFGEVKHIEFDQYKNLGLPMQLRYLPDLLVADLEVTEAFLVEVKFRRRFNGASAKTLYQELMKQREYWPDSYAVLIIAEPIPEDGKFHQDYIRVVGPNETDCLVDKTMEPGERWKNLDHLQKVFTKFHGSPVHQEIADFITPALKNLADL